MKTHILFFICFFTCNTINAQIDFDFLSAFPPVHPMDTRIGNKPTIRPDTLIIKSENDHLTNTPVYIHKYGDDGYIDTVKVLPADVLRLSFEVEGSVRTYSKENNKLISVDSYFSFDPSHLAIQLSFEYDSIGRLVQQRHIKYDRDSNKTIRNDTVNYDFSTVEYIDNGYIFNGATYLFDNNGRLIREISTEQTISYIYFDNESRYTMSITSDWRKGSSEEYFFNENNLLTKTINYHNNNLEVSETTDYLYYFSPGNATSNSLITNIPDIYGTTGGLRINTKQPEWIFIYTLSGQLVKKEYVNQNQQIPLPRDIYIVKSTNKTFKVVVK